MFLSLLVVAGNETTRNAITGGLVAFSRFPDQKERLLDDPELIDTRRRRDRPLRLAGHVASAARSPRPRATTASSSRQGEKVLMLYQSANRDERVFDDPDEFRIDRDPNPHLGFGIGTHFCLGANLARVEIKVVFEELFARLRDIRVADGARARRAATPRSCSPSPAPPGRLHPERVMAAAAP